MLREQTQTVVPRIFPKMRLMPPLVLPIKLRLTLRSLLQLVEELIAGRLLYATMYELSYTLSTYPFEEIQDLAYECVRDLPPSKAQEISTMLTTLSRLGGEPLEGLNVFSQRVWDVVKMWRPIPPLHHQGFVRALKMAMHEPDRKFCFDGTPRDLFHLLENAPQRTDEGEPFRWILGGGWAVELLTHTHRPHGDVDVITNQDPPLFLDCRNGHERDYLGNLRCKWEFLRRECTTEVFWNFQNEISYYVIVLRPEFLLVSKLLRSPKSRAWQDIDTLIEHFAISLDLNLVRRLVSRSMLPVEKRHEQELMQILKTRKASSIKSKLKRLYG